MVCLGIILTSGMSLAAEKIELLNDMDRINYSIGYQIGGDFQKQQWELKPEILNRGISDAVNKSTPLLPQSQMNATLVDMKKKLVADQQLKSRQADGVFLTENAKREGVTTLPTGVQYRVIKAGKGKQPTLKDNVTIKYRVSRVDGQDSPASRAELEPKTYPLKKALPGLQQVLPLMKEGAVWQIVLPPGPALGGRGEALERAGVLIYDLELVSVQQGS